MERIKDRRRFRTTLSSEDKSELNELIVNELINNGITPEDVPLMSSASILLQAFNTLFDDVTTSIQHIARESNLLHAEYPSSLFNQLAQHTDEIVIARPSKLFLFVRIPVEDVIRYGRRVQDNTWELKYDDSNTVEIDGYTFMPVIKEFFMRVTKLNNGKKVYRVFYNDDKGHVINTLVQQIKIEGVETIGFKAEFKQIVVEELTFHFDDSELSKFIVKTKLPISDFELFYKPNLSAAPVKINKRLYYTRGAGDFMEYQILGNNTVAVLHKYIQGGFRPARGGVLIVRCYTTTGENVYYKLPAVKKDFTQATSRVEYEPVGKRIFESKGGNLAETDTEYLRNKVIQLRGARRRIDTETDMYTFLLNYEGDSTFLPRLVHNDIKHRIFNIYAVLSFSSILNGIKRVFTIPTNTGTLSAILDDIPSKEVNGFKYYCLNHRDIIKSEQSRSSDYFRYDKTIKPGKEPLIPVKTMDNPNNNLYTYYYIAPCIISYDINNNFARTYMAAQYDESYLTFQTYELVDETVPVRFVNTVLRVDDHYVYKRKSSIENYEIKAEIRAEADDYTLEHLKTFQAYLEVEDVNKVTHRIPCTNVTPGDNDKYELTFSLETDKRVYNEQAEFRYVDDDDDSTTRTIILPTRSKMTLICSIKTEDQTRTDYKDVSKYQGTVDLYKEITKDLYLQTEHLPDDRILFLSTPMVKSDFYSKAGNQKRITEEIRKIIMFLERTVYDELDEYSSRKNDIHDIMETNLRVSIKFAKTYGLSKFLDVGEVNRTFVHNLQVRPRVLIRKADPEFEESAIASELNQSLIKHDYFMEDLHMSSLIYSVLNKAGDAVTRIQFINFDNYPDNYHMIVRNDQTPNNLDPPEVISIEPVYDEVADTYKFNMTFTTI